MTDSLPWILPVIVAGVLAWRHALPRALTLFLAHATACAALVALLLFITRSGVGRIAQAMPEVLQGDVLGPLACSAFISIAYLLIVRNGSTSEPSRHDPA